MSSKASKLRSIPTTPKSESPVSAMVNEMANRPGVQSVIVGTITADGKVEFQYSAGMSPSTRTFIAAMIAEEAVRTSRA